MEKVIAAVLITLCVGMVALVVLMWADWIKYGRTVDANVKIERKK